MSFGLKSGFWCLSKLKREALIPDEIGKINRNNDDDDDRQNIGNVTILHAVQSWELRTFSRTNRPSGISRNEFFNFLPANSY